MYRISKEIGFDAAHRLINYSGKCAMLHGHRYTVEMEFSDYELDECGFVIDFSDVGKEVKSWIDDHWDHGTLLNEGDPLVPVFKEAGQKLYTMSCNPTAENIARELHEIFIKVYGNLVSVTVWETPTSKATYYDVRIIIGE